MRGASGCGTLAAKGPVVRVHLLLHVHRYEDGHENIRVIGVFSSRRKARDAVRQLRNKSGFRERKKGFDLSTCVLDHAHWTQGYGGGPVARLLRAEGKRRHRESIARRTRR